MNGFKALLFKPLIEWKNNIGKNRLRDVWGMILSIILIVALFYVYITVGMAAIKGYLQIKVDGVVDVTARIREALTLLYGVILLTGVIGSIKEINNRLFENEDNKIYLTLPISSVAIFSSQLLIIYIKQFAKTLLYVMSLSIMFEIITHQGYSFILTSLLTSFLIPFFTIGIASFLVFPYYYIKRVLGGRHIFVLIVTTLVLGLIFWGYSYIVDLFSQLLASGEIKFFFSQKTMDVIANVTKYLYPANIYCDFNIGIKRVANLFIILAISIAFSILGYLICNKLYISIVQEKLSSGVGVHKYLNVSAYSQPTFGAMITKEFITVLRTPSYAFEYFSTALVMPLMVVLCMKIGVTFLDNLLAVDCNFELAIFCVMIFSMLTNTFCATNVSRDGSAFWLMKTYPFSAKKYLMSKVIFCSIISTLAVLISTIIITAMKFISIEQGCIVCLIGSVFAFSQIMFATKCDLLKPHFVDDESGEVIESNSTINMIILLGMISALLVGGGILLIKVLTGMKNHLIPQYVIYILLALAAILGLVIALCIFFVNLDKHYSRLTEGD